MVPNAPPEQIAISLVAMRFAGKALLASLGALACAALVAADANFDWLIEDGNARAQVLETCWEWGENQLCGIELTNGLVSRRFVTSPGFGTVDYILNASTAFGGEQSMFRTVKPEAVLQINGTLYNVGGLAQLQPLPTVFLAYCNRSDFTLTQDVGAFQYVSHFVTAPEAPFPWTPGTRHSPKEYAWPPAGVVLGVQFALAPTVGNWTVAADFGGNASTSLQVHELTEPVTARYWKGSVLSTDSPSKGYPARILEIAFQLTDGTWLNNSALNASGANFVTGASGYVPARLCWCVRQFARVFGSDWVYAPRATLVLPAGMAVLWLEFSPPVAVKLPPGDRAVGFRLPVTRSHAQCFRCVSSAC